MNNDNGNQNFAVGIDFSRLKQDAEACKKILVNIGDEGVRQGDIIDRAFKSIDAANMFGVLEAAINKAGKSLTNVSFDTAESKIAALSMMIEENEKQLSLSVDLLEKWQEEARVTFSSGDTETLKAINKDIEEQITEIAELTKETEYYRGVLQSVMATAQMNTQTDSIVRVFDGVEDIKHVEELRKGIIALRTEISRTDADNGNIDMLTSQLSQMKEELNDCETRAAKTASALGADLGGRAAEAQQTLYSLNSAIEEQERVIKNLSVALTEARARNEELQRSDIASADAKLGAAAACNTLADNLALAKQQLAGLQASQVVAQEQWRAVSEEIEHHDSVMVKMLGGYDNYQNIVKQLPQPLRGAISGIEGMTGAAKSFLATPLGAALAAIVLALQTVKTWLNSTVEGQLKFAEISGCVSGVLGQLKEIVIDVGEAIFKAFSKPKQAVGDLWESIKTNLVNRFKAVGDMATALGKVLKSALTPGNEGLKEARQELADSFLQFNTGVENLREKAIDWGKGVGEAAKATADISRANKELEIEISEWQKRNQELELQKAKARGAMYDTSLSTEERRKAEADYEAALNEQIATETKHIDRKIELQKRSMELASNTIEDESKLRELETQKIALETRKMQELATLQRRSGAWNNSDDSEARRREDALVSLGNMEADLILSNNKMEISLMQDGHKKRMEELIQEREEELHKLEELKQKFQALNTEAGVDVGEDGLSDMQRTQLVSGRENVERAYKEGVRLILEDELSDILTYEQRRLKIQEEFAEKREALYEMDVNGDKVLKQGVIEGNIEELLLQQEEALNAIDSQFAAREDTFEAWCNEIANMSLKELEQVLKSAEEALKEAEGNGASGSQLAAARAKVNTAKEKISKESAKETNTSPSKRSLKEWEDLYGVLNECNGAFEEIGETVGGVAGEIISTAGEITSSTLSMINGIVQLVTMSASGMTATAATAATAISMVEKASVILAVISAALQVAVAIANMFNSDDDKQEEIEHLQGRIDQLQWELDHIDVMRLRENNIDTLKMLRDEVDANSVSIGKQRVALWTLEEAYNRLKHSNVNYSETLVTTANKLANAYANVAYSANKALGVERYKAAKDDLNNIVKQQFLIQEQIDAELSKKKKVDHDQIKEWEQEIEKLGAQAIEMINEMVEDIIGGTSTEIANELADAFFEAFEAGEDAAEAWGNKVNDIVADILKRMMIQEFLEKPMGEIFNRYKAKWFKGNDFQGIDVVVNSLSDFASDLKNAGSTFSEVWAALPDDIRSLVGVTADTLDVSATQRGIATASQESVDENNARLTTIQGHTYSINENINSLVQISSLILQSVVNIDNTTNAIEGGVRRIVNNMDDISSRGIRIAQ